MMLIFIYLFIFRSASGAQNGFGYYGKEIHRAFTTLFMSLMLIGFILYVSRSPENILKAVSVILALVSVLGTIGVEVSFKDNSKWFNKDIHFWEVLATGGVTLAFFTGGFNMIPVIASIYPALILHKGFINLGSKKPWFYEGTDDKTGKTFGIPSMGIKIPRMGTMGRLSLAVLSVMAMIINLSLRWSVSIYDLINLFQ